MDHEPSILDYLLSKIQFWKKTGIQIPKSSMPVFDESTGLIEEKILIEEEDQSTKDEGELEPSKESVVSNLSTVKSPFPWRVFLALCIALVAQLSLEPKVNRSWLPGAVLYLISGGLLIWSILRNEFSTANFPGPDNIDQADQVYQGSSWNDVLSSKWEWLIPGFILSILAFLSFKTGADQYKFTWFNLLVWLGALVFMASVFWQKNGALGNNWKKIKTFFTNGIVHFKITPWALLVIIVFGLALYFRFHQLNQVPSQMVSDHAEKLLDVGDILKGQTSVYFPRNTGREFFQMYWTALIIIIFKTGLSFISLKLGTVILGVLTLPYIYLLGKELGNRRIGLIAMAFAGMAYWPNLISRIALRFTLYPFFFAPALYYFLKGIRNQKRNDFVLAGLFVGLGLQGYSPYRVVPILLVIGLGIFLLHKMGISHRSERRRAAFGLLIIAVISMVIFLPLLRYMLAYPDMVGYRAITRLSSVEQPIQGNPWLVFFENLWRAMTMFAWDDGEVWVISITHRPVLDFITGGLFHLGLLAMVVRYIKKRNWLDLFIPLSIPILMLPSILSLAFPGENPCLNRTAGAIIPVFLLVGFALDGIMRSIERVNTKNAIKLAWAIFAILLMLASIQNYSLVFNQYKKVYQASAWNTSDIGHVIRGFSESVGSADTAFLVAYPHWVDSRLVGINAGYPFKDYALWTDQFESTLQDPRAKLFVININDNADIEKLAQLYPTGSLSLYDVPLEGKDFYIFFVPPAPITKP